jgi:hypothetical protein
MEKTKIIPAKIHPLKIEVIDSYINDNIENKNPNFDFSIAHAVQHNLKDERIKITLFINLLSDTNNEIGIKFNIDFHYKIDDLEDHYKLNENNTPIFSMLFIATIVGISFSTARGIIFSQLQNTKLNNLILPVIDPIKMIAPKNN